MLVKVMIQMGFVINHNIFILCQIFDFGSISFISNSTSHLGPVETYVADQVLFFGNLEFIADSRGELIL